MLYDIALYKFNTDIDIDIWSTVRQAWWL